MPVDRIGSIDARALVVASLRRLLGEIDDPAARAEIESRIATLEGTP